MSLESVDAISTAGAAANAAWCDAVVRSHGLSGSVSGGAWLCTRRTPPLYPDAVTLARGVDPEDLLSAVDSSVGCSVKDSFLDLDLGTHGFSVLLEAVWLMSDAQPESIQGHWMAATDGESLAVWEAAWQARSRSDRLGPARVFRDVMADDANVAFVGRWRGDRPEAGAVLTRGPTALSLSNLFCLPGAEAETVAAVLAWAARWAPGEPVTTYASVGEVGAAVGAGFRRGGPLRVWHR